MPFINRHAPKENSTLWLGVYIAPITMGGAGGYVYGSALADSSLTWAGAFYGEGILMIPAILLVLFSIPDHLDAVPLEQPHIDDLSAVPLDSDDGLPANDKTFLRQWGRVFRHIPFTLIALGYAAYTFMLGCFTTFSPTLLISLGFFTTESDASFTFGLVSFVSGTVGTLVGGFALDRLTQRNTVTQAQRSAIAATLMFRLLLVATVCGIVMTFFTKSKLGFFVLFGITYLIIAGLVPSEQVAIMEMFPESRQAMAVAANTAVLLALGDIPSPVVLGWLKDTWAPRCGTVDVNGDSKLDPECPLDQSGLRHLLLFSILWLLWAVVLWAAALWMLRRKTNARAVLIDTPEIK